MSEQESNGPIVIPADAGYVRNALLKHLGKQLEKPVRGGWKGEAHLSLVEEGDEMGFMLRVFPEGDGSPINSSGDIESKELITILRTFHHNSVITAPDRCVEQWVAANACVKLRSTMDEIVARLNGAGADQKLIDGRKYLVLSSQGIEFVVRDVATGKTLTRNQVSSEKFPKDVVLELSNNQLTWADHGLPAEVSKVLDDAGKKTNQERVNNAMVAANVSEGAMEMLTHLLTQGPQDLSSYINPFVDASLESVQEEYKVRDAQVAELREFGLIVEAVTGFGDKYVGATEKAIEVFKFHYGDSADFEAAYSVRNNWGTSGRHHAEASKIGPEFMDVLLRFVQEGEEEIEFPQGWGGQTDVKGRVHFDTSALMATRSAQYLVAHRLLTIQSLSGMAYGYGINSKKAIFLTSDGVELLKFVCGKSLTAKQAKQWAKTQSK